MSAVCYLLAPRGFCSGVTRAINMAEQVVKLYGTVYITEDIIHNKAFMNEMLDRGFVKVSSIDDIPYGSAVMFSAHGVCPFCIDKSETKELTIIDGTCPIVKSIQKSIKMQSDQGKKIIIIGDRSHAEVIGFLGYAKPGNVFVVYNELDVDLLPNLEGHEAVYFTQTTLDSEKMSIIVDRILERFPHVKSDKHDNICFASKNRQAAVREIAKSVDLFIVVGSKHSSNSNRLAEVAISSGAKNAILIDDSSCLNKDILNGASVLAITAGASTPEYLIQDVVSFLRQNIADLRIEEFEPFAENDSKNQ